MHPLAAALALLIDRLSPALDPFRARPLAARYLAQMREQFGSLEPLGPLVAVLFLLAVPVGLASLALWLAFGVGAFAEVVLGIALTVLALGPRSALPSLEAYPRALERDDAAAAELAARALIGAHPSTDPVERSSAVARAMPQALHDAATAPAFWALLAGPVGAVAWRAACELERALDESSDPWRAAQMREARRVLGVLGWLPTRVTALAIAAMGKSELAFNEWRTVRAAQRAELRAAPLDGGHLDLRARDEHLLARVAEAALRVRPDEEDQGLHLAWSMAALAERAWLAWVATLIAIAALVWIA